MNEIQINNICKKITLVDKQKGQFVLDLVNNEGKDFLICVNTEKFFDNNAPSYKLVKNGKISVDINNEDGEVYELMIMTTNKNESFNVYYNINKKLSDNENNVNSVNSGENQNEMRTKLFNELSIFEESLPTNKNKSIFQNLIKQIVELYKQNEFEKGDEFLIHLNKMTKVPPSEFQQFLLSMNDENEIENENQNNNNENKKEECGSSEMKYKYNMLNYGLLIFLFLIVIVFIGYNIFNSNKKSIKNIFNI